MFKFQISGPQRLLSKTVDFVFLSGHFVRTAGDSVLPFFEGHEPFYRWRSKSDDNKFTREEVEKEVRTVIENTLNTRDDWVGFWASHWAAGWLRDC
jgi:hypothetical protein